MGQGLKGIGKSVTDTVGHGARNHEKQVLVQGISGIALQRRHLCMPGVGVRYRTMQRSTGMLECSCMGMRETKSRQQANALPGVLLTFVVNVG